MLQTKLNEKVKVIFRKYQGEILALFPELPGTNEARTCLCYAHVGQHSSANYHWVIGHSKPAKPDEYKALHAELTGIGYELEIKQKAANSANLVRLAEINRTHIQEQ